MSVWAGIDVGGTFTDVILYSDDGATVTIAKVPSTPEDPGQGLLDGLDRALAAAGADPADLTVLVHGTTVGTNALLERNGARVGIITTAGFEDTLFIGRAKRRQMYDLRIGPQTPSFLCPRGRVRGVSGRLGPGGSVVEPLDEQAVVDAADYLVREQRVESIAVNLLMSFASPVQEERVEEIIRARHPGVSISLSSRVDPRFREYERLVVTTMDAYIRPKIASYIGGLYERLRAARVGTSLLVMESHGGIVDSSVVVERSVGTLLSGLAGGAIGAAAVGGAAQRRQVLSFDMGGTSTDVALIVGSRPLVGDEGTIGDYPIRLPMVDVHTIGAGGGSIAHVDAAGSLRVGPHSAGASPGPAAYGQGGTAATVTDAAVVLGFLGAGGLAGGALALDPQLAHDAVRTQVAEPMGVTTVEAAWGIHRIAVAAMASAVRVMSVGRGHDPRQFTLLACGGAGPLHACGVADELGITEILVPPYPGVLSAYGLLAADAEIPQWRTYRCRLTPDAGKNLQQALASLEEQVRAKMVKTDVDPHSIRVEVSVAARYVGQSHELRVAADAALAGPALVAAIQQRFEQQHLKLYGQTDPSGTVEVTAVQATAIAPRSAPPPGWPGDVSTRPPAERSMWVPESDSFESVPSIDRAAFHGEMAGPALVLQDDTTTLIRHGWTARVDSSGSLLLTRDAAGLDETDAS